MSEDQQNQNSSGGITFTPEQQQEVNRIVAREKAKAAEKAQSQIRAEYQAVDENWLGFIQRFTRDPKEATQALAQHVGINMENPTESQEVDDDLEDETPREKKLREMLERQSSEIYQLKGLIGNVFNDKAETNIRKTYGRDGTLTKDELSDGLKAAKNLMANRPGLDLSEAFELANREKILAGVKRRFSTSSSTEDDEQEEITDVFAIDDDEDLPPVKLGDTRGKPVDSRKKPEKIPDILEPFIGEGGIFESAEDYRKWGGSP